ncbi:MAG TPA: RNA 2'-phosphotransferase [Candidatus Limivivens intestinipullorum]|uniref:Probable RNA 2'-phosphotransferase n=1 Tax=Candidatus Limivivens intestinipullorum TaxID=2840858 RepID=A0A9D1EX44_9FIRM|nr:RNA 2'-phosphotransferase [Candidatus Limivivens intestinipullorum]
MSYEKVSKYMSLILRHHPETIGISLDEHGWADVEELIAGIARTNEFSREILEEIVRTDAKQRYAFNADKTKIRASQGHSIPVDLELKAVEPPEMLWHGTAEKYVASIEQTGLRPGSRRYVHLSRDRETARTVGSRHGRPVIYRVKSGEMYRKGFRFYCSENGVWLTILVPPEYLQKENA